MKKFFYLLFSVILVAFFTFSLTGCKKSEVEKISKNLTAYSIDAKLDDEKKEMICTEKINYVNTTGGDLEFLCFHMYPRAFREGAIFKPYTTLTEASCFPNGISFGDLSIVNVKVNGEVKKFEIGGEDEDILKVNFGFKLTNKKTIEIVIDFVLIIPNSTHRFGYYDLNVNIGNWYPIVCEYVNGKFDTTPYYATGDPFFSSIANYEVNFSYPKKYKLCSTGEAQITESSETLTAKIKAKAVRDFAMCLSQNSEILEDKQGDTKVYYLGKQGDSNNQKYLEIAKEATAYFGKVFGAYPYSTLTVAKTPFVYGGMEYPNLVYVSDSVKEESEILKIIVHEIAHQWWYAVVGNNETQEAWLDESLSEYSTALFFKENTKYGITYDELISNALSSYMLYVDVVQTIRGDVITKMNLPVNEYQNDYEYSYMVYVKGVIMFDSLKEMVGEKKLLAGFKKYYAENKFKNATKQDFYDAFSAGCHKDLNGFFEGFLNGTTIISNIK